MDKLQDKHILLKLLEKSHISIKNHYPELKKFESLVVNDPITSKTHPYSANKSRVLGYQAVFIGFAMIFLYIALFLYFKNLNWTYSFLFGTSYSFKSILVVLCTLFSSASFSLGILLKTEIETIKEISSRAKKRLKKLIKKKKSQESKDQYLSIYHNYHDALDLLEHKKEKAIYLMKRIRRSMDHDNQEKELLFNQACLEFERQLRQLKV